MADKIKKIGIIANIQKTSVLSVVPSFIQWLCKRKAQIIISDELQKKCNLTEKNITVVQRSEIPRMSDFIVSLGGDGTLLYTSQLIGELEIPILGVNLGGLGFLTEIALEDFYINFEKVLCGDYSIEKRMTLKIQFSHLNSSYKYHALNDIVLDRASSPRVIRVDVNIDEDFFNTYVSDGIIISTPTGSTAYSLSAWGPIVLPSLESMIINPICPHALTVRPVVIPASCILHFKIHPRESDTLLSVDGQENIYLKSGTEITVSKGDYYINLITLKGHSFFNLLRQKLQWGSLPHK